MICHLAITNRTRPYSWARKVREIVPNCPGAKLSYHRLIALTQHISWTLGNINGELLNTTRDNLDTTIRGGNKIWIFKPQVNFDVIPTYKHGGKWFFEFGGHLNPPHLRWSFRFFGDFRPFQRNFYIFINAGLEPKLFEIKSSTQQQSCKAHKIGQFRHQDQPSICLCSRVTDRATTAFQLAPKW